MSQIIVQIANILQELYNEAAMSWYKGKHYAGTHAKMIYSEFYKVTQSESENSPYEGCSGSSWNLVIKCSNTDMLLSCFDRSQVDIIELASRS